MFLVGNGFSGMKKSDLIKMVRKAAQTSIKESAGGEWSEESERDERAYADHLRDLGTGPQSYSSSETEEIQEFLRRILSKVSKATSENVDRNTLAHVLELLEQVDELLYQGGLVEEGFQGMDRQTLIGNAQALAKRIATKIGFSSISDGALSAMLANLQAIANKL